MSAGPNLLAWAKDYRDKNQFRSDSDPEIFAIARAILADEEERKQNPERPLAFGRLLEPPSE